VSNRSRIQADSAYIFYDMLSPHFTQSHDFIFVSPFPLSDTRSEHVYFEFGFNKYETRYSFPWNEIGKILRDKKPSVIIVNQIELLPNYKALLETLGHKCLIVGYTHYIPYGLDKSGNIIPDDSLSNGGMGEPIRLNFFSGLQAADMIFIHSNTALNFIKSLYNELNTKFPEEKYIINPPPKDPFLTNDNKVGLDNKAFYNHRLYKHYGSEFFVSLADAITDRFNIELNVFDVLGERSEVRQRMDPSVDIAKENLSKIPNVHIITDNLERSRYKKTMQGSLFSIAPFKENCIWAMSCIDSMSMGIPVIAPKTAWFDEFMPDDLKFTNIGEALRIIDKLKNNKVFWLEKSKEAMEKTRFLAPEERAHIFLTNFNKGIGE
jgi:hypothetical protein